MMIEVVFRLALGGGVLLRGFAVGMHGLEMRLKVHGDVALVGCTI